MVFRPRKLTDRVQTLIDEMLHVLRHESMIDIDNQCPRLVQVARLEDRVLMSASPMAMVAEALTSGTQSAEASTGADATLSSESQDQTPEISGSLSSIDTSISEFEAINESDSQTLEADAVRGPELIVIDYRVQDADTLLTSLLDTDRDFRLLRLDANEDGLRQITDKLEQLGNVSAIHLLTHGRDGEILLGSTRLNASTLAQHAPELLAWQHSLTANADLLLYGCDVAESPEGHDFVESLAKLTGVDIAASTDGTGHESLSGNWNFEYFVGSIETTTPFRSEISQDWNGLLATMVVTNTSDSGGGSLRQAILDANASPGLDTITFNISDGASGHYYYQNDSIAGSLTNVKATTLADGSITDFDPDYPYAQHSWFRIDLNPASGALAMTSPVIIDGYSQPGASPNYLAVGHNSNLRIELTSTGADGDDGLEFLTGSSGSSVRGLTINSFDFAGIRTDSGVNNVTIQGNFLGTDITGTIDLGNNDGGVHLRSSGNLVGGPNPADRNVISGNNGGGVVTFTFGPIATNNVVENNSIGVDATGLRGLGNTTGGIQVDNQSGMQIRDNVISGNMTDGIWLRSGSTAANTVIQGNLIGVGVDGATAIGNGGAGILVENTATSTTIGGVLSGESNTLAYNAVHGVAMTSGTRTAVRGNLIFSNGGLGIDLNNNAGTLNDLGDLDGGPNGLQNYPIISSAVITNADLTVAGTLNTTAFLSGNLDFYWSAVADPAGHGEAQNIIGSTSVTTNIFGNASFHKTFVGVSVPVGAVITATMTDSFGNTSEFSLNRTAVSGNAAPVLDPAASPIFTPMNEDAGVPAGAVGTRVSSLVDFSGGGGLDNVTDPDAGALLGVVVTAADSTNGAWWYSTSNGSTWNALGAVSDANARLLAADVNTRLYFQPNADWYGTVPNGITFHAWDQTSGVSGGTAVVNASTILDRFSSVAYNNNDGTANWSSAWVEHDSNGGGADGGRIHVNGNKLEVKADSIGDSIYREADLSGATSATLSFDYVNTLSGLDRIDVQISSDGGASYSTVAAFSQSPHGAGSTSVDMTPYIASDTRVRFYVSGSEHANHARFDNVRISFGTGSGGMTAFSSSSDSASITVNPVNDVPAVSLATTTLSYTEQAAPLTIDSQLTITDPDNTSLTGAIVTIANGSLTGPDELLFTPWAGITGTFDAATDTLTFTGTASIAEYQTVLRSLYFRNLSDTPLTSVRTVNIQVSDGTATGSGSRNVLVTAVNDSPTINPATFSIAENSANGTLVGVATVSDPDAGDTRTFAISHGNPGGAFAINAATGQITVANSAALDFETKPSFSLTVRASDAGGLNGTGNVTVSLTNVNDAPTVTGRGFQTTTDQTLNVSAPGLLTTAVDADGDTFQVIIAQAPSHGTLVSQPDGTFRYEPNAVNAKPPGNKGVRDDDLAGLATLLINQDLNHDAKWITPVTLSTDIAAGSSNKKSHAALNNSGHRIESADVTDAAASHNVLKTIEDRREVLYRQLTQDGHVWQQLDSFEEELSESTQLDPVIVGSVGVVGTGLSVGYLIWIVRFGTVLSGLLAQVPAWTMLDPLLVMDGQDKEEDQDQESVQTIVDQQQPR